MKEKALTQKEVIKRVAHAPIYIALGLVVFSFLVHGLGIPLLGTIILPLHFFVLFAGIVEGATIGVIVGFSMPILNFAIFGMPPYPVFIFMMIELAIYGLISGLLRNKNIYFNLIISMLAGRGIYMIAYYILGIILNINLSPITSILMSYLLGIPGIILQLLFIPLIVKRIPKTLK